MSTEFIQKVLKDEGISFSSLYVSMRDGVRIAIDVMLPKGFSPGDKVPSILMMTRYWRSRRGDDQQKLYFATHGYAMITGDSRGTGASFGIYPHHRNREEVLDFGEIVDWIVNQSWSNGKVGAYGVSYTANTADWTAQNNRAALKAIVVRYPDFDPYTEEYFPGGIRTSFGKRWSDMVRALDLNVPSYVPPQNIRPVDGDKDGRLLSQAIEQRKLVPEIIEGLRQITFRDDRPSTWNASMDNWSISSHVEDLKRSKVAMYIEASWFDVASANGALDRFISLPNPQRVVIGTWFHAGEGNANPLTPRAPANTGPEGQFGGVKDVRDSTAFFSDQYLKGTNSTFPPRSVLYYNVGEEKWKSTTVWPPEGSVRQEWFFEANQGLGHLPSTSMAGEDHYKVNFDATNGEESRWFPGDDVDATYTTRAEQDLLALTYTSEPLSQPIQITGHPTVKLFIKSTAPDGAFIVYLEQVDPAGHVTHITEGELRAIHRKISEERPPHNMLVPYHSFLKKDALPLVPGEVAELRFGLLPISFLLGKGNRIRVTIVGADKDRLEDISKNESPLISVIRNKQHASSISLPIIEQS